MGLVGVGASSAFAGHMTRHTGRQLEAGKNPLQALITPFWSDGVEMDEVVLDALLGATMFKVTSACTSMHAHACLHVSCSLLNGGIR